ncbi:MAG: glycosyltransferase [Oscillospiraceae bacterium]|nr:glycosyltransferase [Oscillospiraceae bacterium]
MYTASDHTFVICAYKESGYLEECVRSLQKQTVPSKMIVSTSTPNGGIEALCEKYGLPLFINTGARGIAEDWNFGYAQAGSPLVTIAHQDDIYEPGYLEGILRGINGAKRPLIAFSGYGELRGGKTVWKNRLLKIKRLMLWPLRFGPLQKSRFIRRRILSMGCPICCPAVTYVADNLPVPVFTPHFKSNVDWQAWERLSREKGAFVYVPKALMKHRIHGESATSEIIGASLRGREDYEMLCKFWPRWIAGIIEHFYKQSENSNKIA